MTPRIMVECLRGVGLKLLAFDSLSAIGVWWRCITYYVKECSWMNSGRPYATGDQGNSLMFMTLLLQQLPAQIWGLHSRGLAESSAAAAFSVG